MIVAARDEEMLWCYSVSTGAAIQVFFCLACPPRLSYLCVHFPGSVRGPAVGTGFGPAPGTPAVRCVWAPPLVVSTHSDLALIRVPVPGGLNLSHHYTIDYFVYTARRGLRTSSLERLPESDSFPRFQDEDAAILRCSGSRYVIAVLRNTPGDMEFRLHLYDSDTGCWTSKLLSLQEPMRDRVLPIPDSATEMLFHNTTKVITLGSTTIGWVDLWRGILFCNVLDEYPVPQDMPLPKPARCNKNFFCCGSPYGHRDITVVKLPEQQQMSIKYVEMGSRPGDVPSPRPRPVDHSSSGSDDDDVNNTYYWTATVWTMPVPIVSWHDRHKDCTIDVTNIAVDNPRHCELLLPGLSIDPEEATVTFRRLLTGHPTLALRMDGHVVIYFLYKMNSMDREGWMIAVGMQDNKLHGIAKLDDRKNFAFRRYYCPTEISKYMIDAAGEAGTLVRTWSSRRKYTQA